MSRNFELMEQAEIAGLSDASQILEHPNSINPLSVHSPGRRQKRLALDTIAQEECLKLVQNLFFGDQMKRPQVVVFAGVDPGDGCSHICVQAAAALANNTPKTVCLVEANLRTPSLPAMLGVPNHHGLTDSLVKEGGIRTFAKQMEIENLWLLSAGALTADSRTLLNSDQLRSRLLELRKEFDYVLIDVPPLNHYADALVLGRISDGTVLVLSADSTRRESAMKGMDSLNANQIPVLGAVLNKRSFPIPDFVYRRL